MDPPKVLLEASFLQAVTDAEHPRHDACVAAYRELVAQYQREELLLVAVGDHLRAIDLGPEPTDGERSGWFVHRPRTGVFAPVDPLYVGFQHRRAAARTLTNSSVDDPTVALTLVMCNRHKVRRMATAGDAYAGYEIDVLPLASA